MVRRTGRSVSSPVRICRVGYLRKQASSAVIAGWVLRRVGQQSRSPTGHRQRLNASTNFARSSVKRELSKLQVVHLLDDKPS